MKVFNQDQYESGSRTKLVLIVLIFIALAGVVIAGTRFLGQEQDIRNRAAEPTGTISCPANGAMCQWTTVTGASGYRYLIEENVNGQWTPVHPTCACATPAPGNPTPVGGGNFCGCTTTETHVNFTSKLGSTYRCKVQVLSNNPQCVNLQQDTSQLICGLKVTPSVSPTPTGKPGCYQQCTPGTTGVTGSVCAPGLSCVKRTACPTTTPGGTSSPTSGATPASNCYWCYATTCPVTPTITPTRTVTPTPRPITPTGSKSDELSAFAKAQALKLTQAAQQQSLEPEDITSPTPSRTPSATPTPTIEPTLPKTVVLQSPDEPPSKPTIVAQEKPAKNLTPTKAPIVTAPPPRAGTMTNLLIMVAVSVGIIIFGFVFR